MLHSEGIQGDEFRNGHNATSLPGEAQYVNSFHTGLDDSPLPRPTDRPSDLYPPSSPRHFKKGDANYLLPYKKDFRPDLSRSHSGSEADSLIDLYGHPRSTAERSVDSGPQRSESHEGMEGEPPNEGVQEQSSWIHRDKLAIIERQEMRAAGITPPPMRESSRSRHRKDKSRDQPEQAEIEAEIEKQSLQLKPGKRRQLEKSRRKPRWRTMNTTSGVQKK